MGVFVFPSDFVCFLCVCWWMQQRNCFFFFFFLCDVWCDLRFFCPFSVRFFVVCWYDVIVLFDMCAIRSIYLSVAACMWKRSQICTCLARWGWAVPCILLVFWLFFQYARTLVLRYDWTKNTQQTQRDSMIVVVSHPLSVVVVVRFPFLNMVDCAFTVDCVSIRLVLFFILSNNRCDFICTVCHVICFYEVFSSLFAWQAAKQSFFM